MSSGRDQGLAARQALVARFLTDPEAELRVRRDPVAAAQAKGVPLELARWLAGLDPRRVEAFRSSRVHKSARRRGA